MLTDALDSFRERLDFDIVAQGSPYDQHYFKKQNSVTYKKLRMFLYALIYKEIFLLLCC